MEECHSKEEKKKRRALGSIPFLFFVTSFLSSQHIAFIQRKFPYHSSYCAHIHLFSHDKVQSSISSSLVLDTIQAFERDRLINTFLVVVLVMVNALSYEKTIGLHFRGG